jgi:hypothetical protein
MNRKQQLLNKFFNQDLTDAEKKEFIKIASKDEEFRRAFTRNVKSNWKEKRPGHS